MRLRILIVIGARDMVRLLCSVVMYLAIGTVHLGHHEELAMMVGGRRPGIVDLVADGMGETIPTN